VDGLDRFARLSSAANVGLVSDNNKKETGLLKSSATLRDIRIELELAELRRRGGKSVLHHGMIEDAVAIEKYRAIPYFVLSHFVCAVFSAG
jgi:hypothetical protein